MKKTARSLGFSLSGLLHALRTERNLKIFVASQVLALALGVWLGVDIFTLIFVVMFAGFFLVIELLNTALERLADTLDDLEKQRTAGHYHHGIKLTKDVAAAAALIALIMDVAMIVLLYLPYILARFFVLP